MGKFVRKIFPVKVEDDSIIVNANPPVVDLENERILPSAWDLEQFKKNPVVLYGHDYKSLPIGRAEVWVDANRGLFARLIFDREDKFAAEVERKMRKGFLNAVSVGFIRAESKREGEVLVTTKAILLEISVVPVPANPDALVVSRSFDPDLGDGIVIPTWEEVFDLLGIKGAVPPHSVPVYEPEDAPWDKNKAIAALRKWASSDGSGDPDKINFKKYKLGFGWFDSAAPENLTSYKLPHHIPKNGRLYLHKRGCFAAVAALAGARGGVNIPERDLPGVLRHFKRHYKDLDQPWPLEKGGDEALYRELDLDGSALARVIDELRKLSKLLGL